MLFLPIESAPGPAYRGWKADMGPVDVDFSEGARAIFSSLFSLSLPIRSFLISIFSVIFVAPNLQVSGFLL